MVIGNRAFWFALSCGLTLLVGGALADYLGAPAAVVKASEVNSQGANTAPTFVVGGHVTTDFGPDDYGTSIAIIEDGKLVVAGSSGAGPNSVDFNFALARYLPDGSLDGGFGSQGKIPGSRDGVLNDSSALEVSPQIDLTSLKWLFGINCPAKCGV